MQHYAMYLQAFNYEIRYKNTTSHANADALSRLILGKTTQHSALDETDLFNINQIQTLPLTVRGLAHATETDPQLQILLRKLKSGERIIPKERFNINEEEYSIQDGCIIREIRPVIPQKLKKTVLDELHLGNFGMTKMKALARSYCWWAGIDANIEKLARNCFSGNKIKNDPAPNTDHIWERPTGQSPSMLLMERERSRLDNLIPDVKEKLGTTKEARQVEVGVRVASRNYIGEKWKFGRVHRILGKLHYIINLDDGSRVKRHIDQIRQIEEETASDVEERGPEMIPSEEETASDVEERGPEMIPSEDEGHRQPPSPPIPPTPQRAQVTQTQQNVSNTPTGTVNDNNSTFPSNEHTTPVRKSSRIIKLGLLMIIILRFQVMNIQHQYGSLPELLRNP
ncbi:Integrase zinc binding domain [Popillia japonica]|uniref:RNA-directed DNA polymerase n=1 Tax=Popillia japonica TaxID=7064 RepID=A0AAW1L7C5_POPJA